MIAMDSGGGYQLLRPGFPPNVGPNKSVTFQGSGSTAPSSSAASSYILNTVPSSSSLKLSSTNNNNIGYHKNGNKEKGGTQPGSELNMPFNFLLPSKPGLPSGCGPIGPLPPMPGGPTDKSNKSQISKGSSDGTGTGGGGSLALNPSGSTNLDDEWENEMKLLEEVEKTLKQGEQSIPGPLRDRIIAYIDQYPVIQRVVYYDFLKTLEWDFEHLHRLLSIFERLGNLSELVKLTVEHLFDMYRFYHQHNPYPECYDLYKVTLKFLFDLPNQYQDPYTSVKRTPGKFGGGDLTEELEQMTLFAEQSSALYKASHSYDQVIQHQQQLHQTSSSGVIPPFSPTGGVGNKSFVDFSNTLDEPTHGGGTGILMGGTSTISQSELVIGESGVVGGGTMASPQTTGTRKKRQQVKIHTSDPVQYYYIKEYITEISLQDQYYLMNIIRHLPTFEYETLLKSIGEMTLKEVIASFHSLENQLPTSKNCQLCRNKRLNRLEFRMIHGQYPSELAPFPGNLIMLEDKTTQWSADDETLYSFDLKGQQIYWNKHFPVNLVEICDHCLMEVNKSLSNQGRHTELYHIEPVSRKEHFKALRTLEQQLAAMIMIVAKERKFRRLRENALECIRLTRKGLKTEEEAREQRRIDEERRKEKERQDAAMKKLVDDAMAIDKKWIENDLEMALHQKKLRSDFADLQWQEEYVAYIRPAPKERKNGGKSYHLKEYDSKGLPLTHDAAHRMWGTPDPWEEEDVVPELQNWKSTAIEIDQVLQERRDEIARRKRNQELATLQTIKNYVTEKTTIYQRREEQLRHMAEEYEQNRILKRQYDREERRRLRFLGYLEKEREHMMFEDERSYRLRDYEFELIREQQEREDMFNEECDQCEVDRFWGIDAFEINVRNEERRLREFYEQRVYEANRRLATMGTAKPLKRSEVSLVPLGKLPEDNKFDDDRVRRQAVIKKLKAEEIRSKLKIKLPTVYY